MITDVQLCAAIEADPFHQAMDTMPDLDSFEGVMALIEGVCPSAEREPSGIWSLPTSTPVRATFVPNRRSPATVK